jgi:hypothetical protein
LHRAIGRLHRDAGRVDPARRVFAAARRVIEGVGQRLAAAELKQGFEQSPLFREVLAECRDGTPI